MVGVSVAEGVTVGVSVLVDVAVGLFAAETTTLLSEAALLASLLSATTLFGSTRSVAPTFLYVAATLAVVGILTVKVEPAAMVTGPPLAVQVSVPAAIAHNGVPVTAPVVLVVNAP